MTAQTSLVCTIILLLGILSAAAQGIQKQAFARTESARTPSQDGLPNKRTIYQLGPTASPARGLLILLPGRGEPASDVFRATSLAQQAAQRGFVVVVPMLNDRKYLDSASTHFLG